MDPSLLTAVASQIVFYLPSFLAHLVGFAVAAFAFTRHRTAGVLLGVGTLLQLLASLASLSMTVWTTYANLERVYTAFEISRVASGVGLVASLTRGLGEVVVVAAVGVAALRLGASRGAEGGGTDPYGFPTK